MNLVSSKIQKRKQTILSVAWKGNKLYEHLCAQAAERYELTQNEIDVLVFLKVNGSINTAKDIAKYRVISKSLVCKSVKELVARGFLQCNVDSSDKRVQHLLITDSAQEAVEELLEAQEKFFGMLYSGVTEEEDRVLTGILNKIIANVDAAVKNL